RSRKKAFIFSVRACLISVPRLRLLSKGFLIRKAAACRLIKIATIRLQWNRKAKMMRPAKVVLPTRPAKKFSFKRQLERKEKDWLKMSDRLKRDAMLCALTAALMLAVATPSFAQPTEAQKDAVKSSCRSDYTAHCSSVTPGGEAALQCLAKNMSSLS